MLTIKRAAVIGSGVMGSGIAAHLANAGLEVLLLDIVPKDAADRSMLAKGAIERMLKADPAPFMHKSFARRVTPGNVEDDLGKLADVDWIVEVVLEDPQVKRNLYARIESVRKDGSVVSSNTSTIPLALLTEGLPDRFAQDFLITHFFNPPRYMRLLELVVGPHTRPGLGAEMTAFVDRVLGKGVVPCHDSPGFIANRIGTYWLQLAVNAAFDMGVSVEEADAVMSRPVGVPRTGVFGLIDLIGIDLMPLLAASLLRTLAPDDGFRAIHRDHALITEMIKTGYTGRKGKGGFYAMDKGPGGKRIKMARNLATGAYAEAEKPEPKALAASKTGGLRGLVTSDDAAGQYAWTVLCDTLAYSAALVPEVADTLADVDAAMRLGYNWKFGPFELIDQLGTGWFAERLQAAGKPVPKLLEIAAGRPFYRIAAGKVDYLGLDGAYHAVPVAEGVLRLSDIKRASKPVDKNASAALWDIGDGVLCLEFTSKMNALDDQIMAMIGAAIARITGSNGALKALVVHNEGEHFSVGANLGLALFAANIANFAAVEQMIDAGQKAYRALKYAPFPVVAAPAGMALGGGCEILLHADHVQAHAETYPGLVEVGVGVVPGWGGCTAMLARGFANPQIVGGKGPMPAVVRAFEQIGTAKTAKSAFEARDLMILRESDGITMNRDRVLADAKAKALELAEGYAPPAPPTFRLPGESGRVALEMAVTEMVKTGKATPHDVTICAHLAQVLTGGDTDHTVELSEDALYALEREAFMVLFKTEPTLARIEYMLTNGKPLRN
jgi:3-hydroxyacyl-CoA dehydrogenase